MSNIYLSYKLIKDLASRWEDFDAYELGIIDKEGNKLKSPETSKEKDTYSPYHKIVFNLKRLLQKFVGKNINIQRLTSLFLLKENYSQPQVDLILKELNLPKTINESHTDSYLLKLLENPTHI